MSERIPEGSEVTVVFRKGSSLLIPPFELPREQRLIGETYEKALFRLAAEFGVIASVDRAIPTPSLAESAPRAYIVHPRNGELDRSEFFQPYEQVASSIDCHEYLSEVDKTILSQAFSLLGIRRPLD